MPPKKRRAPAAGKKDKVADGTVTDLGKPKDDAELVGKTPPKRVLRSQSRKDVKGIATKDQETDSGEDELVTAGQPKRKRVQEGKASKTGDDEASKRKEDDLGDGTDAVKSSAATNGDRLATADKEDDEKVTPSTDKNPSLPDATTSHVDTKKDTSKSEAEKVVTVCYKGAVPVDVHVKGSLDYCVYRDSKGRYWDCMLNQSNVNQNNNKFYVMQVLVVESGKSRDYRLWRRWGRVGEVGQYRQDLCVDAADAESQFSKLFKQKTGNAWKDGPEKFQKIKGKYDLVERDFQTDEGKDGEEREVKDVEIPPSKLSDRVQEVISLICDVSLMVGQLKLLKYDANRAPLGKLSRKQILLGYSALKAIEECLEKKLPESELEEACSLYYTRIPHIFGRSGIELIDSLAKLKEELELLTSLENAEAAVEMFLEQCANRNPIDQKYEQLCCDIIPLDGDAEEFKIIEESFLSTHASENHRFKMEVLEVFEVKKQGEEERFKDLGNRQLLWHGSRMTNFAGILGKGLRIAPPEAPVTGYMFGKGVYFADVSSKSAQYCYVSGPSDVAFMLLSEVSLGDCHKMTRAEYRLPRLLPKGKHSTHGVGKFRPQGTAQLKGLPIPMGPLVKQDDPTINDDRISLMFNEFIVYSVEQIRLRYLLKLRISN